MQLQAMIDFLGSIRARALVRLLYDTQAIKL